MIRSYPKINPGCQRYTVFSQVLFIGYCYSMTAYHWYGVSCIATPLRTMMKHYQLNLLSQLRYKTLKALHDDNGHQGLQRVLDILHQKVYWPFMFKDTDCWISQCERCLISKGNYTQPKTKQDSLTAQQTLRVALYWFYKGRTLLREVRRTFLFLLMPSLSIVRPL